MGKIQRSQVGFKEEVYDSWDSGARITILHRKVRLPSNPLFPLSPVQFSDESRRDKRWFKHHNYPKFAIELILQGKVEYRMAERTLTASAGECCILVPGTTVTMINGDEGWRRKLCLIVDGRALESLASAFGFQRTMIIKMPDVEKFAARMTAIADMMESGSDKLPLSTATYDLLGELSCLEARKEEASQIDKVIRFMESNMQYDVTMAELTAIAKCSEATLRRSFYREYALSPFALLRKMRIKKAAEILKARESVAVKTLAYECGFSSVSAFITAFKELYGATPAVWKKVNKNR